MTLNVKTYPHPRRGSKLRNCTSQASPYQEGLEAHLLQGRTRKIPKGFWGVPGPTPPLTRRKPDT